MNIINLTRQAVRGLSTTQTITRNPFNFIIDNLIRLVVKALIPIPLASELVIYFKGPIMAMFAGSILFFITLIFMIYSMLFAPATSASTLSNLLQNGQITAQSIQALNGYIEPGFSDTNIPTKDPFAGTGT